MQPTIIPCTRCGAQNRTLPERLDQPTCGHCQNPLPWIVDVDDAAFQAHIQHPCAYLVKFYSPSCGPCRAISPVLAQLAAEFAGRFKLINADTSRCRQHAFAYRVATVPTMYFGCGGPSPALIAQVPMADYATLRQHIEQALQQAEARLQSSNPTAPAHSSPGASPAPAPPQGQFPQGPPPQG